MVAQIRWEIIDEGVLEQLEKPVQEIGKALAAAFLVEVSLRLRERDERLVGSGLCCRTCRQKFEFSSPRMLTFECHLGVIKTMRSYLACRRCKIYFHPLDAALEAPGRGEVAPVFGNALSLLGAEVTYGTGSRILEAVANRKIDKSTIDRQVQRDGSCLQRLERQEADALWPYDSKGYSRTTDVAAVMKANGFLLSLPPRPGKVLVMQGDGAMANLAQEPDVKAEKLREQKKVSRKAQKEGTSPQPEDNESVPSSFRESVHLVIYRLEDVVRKPVPPRKGQKRRRPKFRSMITRKQYACVVNDPPMFAKQVNRLARLWDYKAYPERVFIGDGADKLWAAGEEYFEPTTEILDINHARTHIHECARILYVGDTKEAKRWGRQWCKHLEKNGPEQLLTHLREMAKLTWSEAASKKLKNLLAYCEEHEHRMNYPEFVKRGYPIASGAIEGANSHLFADRCRRSGQQWKRHNLQALLCLRCASRDGRWDHVMQAVRRKQLCAPLPLVKLNAVASDALLEASAAVSPLPQPPPPRPPSRINTLIPQRKRLQILRSSDGPCSLEPATGERIGGAP